MLDDNDQVIPLSPTAHTAQQIPLLFRSTLPYVYMSSCVYVCV